MRVWVADITYVRMREEFAYLAILLDAFSRRVIGWCLETHMRASLVIAALKMALSASNREGTMRPSRQKSQASTGRWLFVNICIYLFLELGLCVAVKYVFGVTAEKLIGPYLALAAPGVIFLLMVRWLWRWEERGASSTLVAFGWGLSVALFFLAVCAAFFYSSLHLELLNASDAAWIFAMMGASSTVLGFFIPYKMKLEQMSTSRLLMK